jgi:hypothetical protein
MKEGEMTDGSAIVEGFIIGKCDKIASQKTKVFNLKSNKNIFSKLHFHA